MEMTEIKLTTGEKAKLVAYAKQGAEVQERKLYTLNEIELPALVKCRDAVPENAALRATLTSKITEWKNGIKHITESIKVHTDFITAVEQNKAHDFHKCQVILEPIYKKETMEVQLSKVYDYYPRLKRAKESTLYVFAEKIKAIMGVRYGKIS